MEPPQWELSIEYLGLAEVQWHLFYLRPWSFYIRGCTKLIRFIACLCEEPARSEESPYPSCPWSYTVEYAHNDRATTRYGILRYDRSRISGNVRHVSAKQQTSVAGCGLLDRAAEDVVISQRWRRRSGTWGGSTWPLHSFEYLFA